MSDTSIKSILDIAKEQNAIAISFGLYAEAYYSGATYSEEIIMLTSDYERYIEGKVEIDPDGSTEVYVGELDGKHSEVNGNVDVEFYTEEELKDTCRLTDVDADGDRLSNYLFDYNSELAAEVQNRFADYYSSINQMTTLTLTVRQDQVDKIKEFVASLK